MDIQILQEFVTLSVVRNFSIAAEQMHISQPSLSRHMHQLEEEMGQRLIERSMPLMLTAAGKTTLGMATSILAKLETTKRSLLTASEGSSLRSFAIADTYHCPCFAEFVHHYSQDAADLELASLEVRSVTRGKTSVDCVHDGELDLAFASYFGIEGEPVPPPSLPEGLVATALPFSLSRICFLAAKGGSLAQRGSFELRDLERTQVMMPTLPNIEYDHRCVKDLCEKHAGFTPAIDWRPVASMQEFFSLDPGESVYFTTAALSGRYQQYSAWVLDSTVRLFPQDKPYMRQLFIVHRDHPEAELSAVVDRVCEIWAQKRFHSD